MRAPSILGQFTHDPAGPRVVFGRGALARLGPELDRLETRTAVLVAESRHADVATRDRRVVDHVDRIAQHVPEDVAEDARRTVSGVGADTVVAVGGGSAIGLAKAVALTCDVRVLAVPTTFAGSEQTSIWGMSAAGHKRTGRDPRVQPDVVLYDPDLTATMPPQVAGPSGMNALAHCVEALYGPDADPVTDLMALEGARAIARNLPEVVSPRGSAAGEDPAADTLWGAYLAGVALHHAGVGLHHRACHVLGGLFGLDHGGMNAVLLGHAVAWNAPAISRTISRLGRALDTHDVPGSLHGLARTIGAPTSLAAIGMPADGIEEASRRVVEAAADTVRPPTEEGMTALLRRAFDGQAPAVGLTAPAGAA